jgi:membrane associated rhomboid family serine protease
MFLLPDESHFRGRIPWVTFALIGINFVCFAVQLIGGDPINYGYSLTPAKVVTGKDVPSDKLIKVRVPVSHPAKGQAEIRYTEMWVRVPYHHGPVPIHLTLLTSMFMHGGWVHLLGNMWFLWIFGSLVEKMLPHVLFLIYYLACGLGAAVTHLYFDPESVVPCLGASGAISGIVGAYLWLHPLSKLRIWFILVFEVPALIAVPVWLVLQVCSSLAAITSTDVAGGVAYWAHVGGFATGWIFLISLIVWLKAVMRKKPPAPEKEPEGYVTLSTAKYLNRPLPANPADPAQ